LNGSALHCVVVFCSTLQYVAVRCSALQCAVVCCFVVVCCSALQIDIGMHAQHGVPQQQLVAACCSVLQCVAVCCSTLLCVSVSSCCLYADEPIIIRLVCGKLNTKIHHPVSCRQPVLHVPSCFIPWPHYQKIKKRKGSGERG